jgi:pimeloyl-ACP methyl ester carboxylesterase
MQHDTLDSSASATTLTGVISAHAQPSERGRSSAERFLGGVARTMGSIAPDATARWIARRFLTPPRPRVRPEERAMLAQAKRRVLDVGGRSIALHAWGGEGPVALLVHGWGGHAGQMTAFVKPLLESGHRVVAIDAPAHGSSGGRQTHLREMADVLERVIGALASVDVVVCHSMGAAAAGMALARSGWVGRVLMIAPVIGPGPWAHRFADALGLDDTLIRRYVAELERHAGTALSSLGLDGATARRVRGSVLVIHDHDDPFVPTADMNRLVAALPEAWHAMTKGLGHHRILRDPAVVAQGVSFLNHPVQRTAVARWQGEPRPE